MEIVFHGHKYLSGCLLIIIFVYLLNTKTPVQTKPVVIGKCSDVNIIYQPTGFLNFHTRFVICSSFINIIHRFSIFRCTIPMPNVRFLSKH